ncbi:MAG TPA: response regulator [Candidatus Moranbacteria bacterium]|nr:MAG: Response regulator receiver domain protein [Candidatus Moranbacteria bacterium GW2011_GWF1_34_10]HBI16872.1 response regulator [Candidatus Moranbacteria bacterium]
MKQKKKILIVEDEAPLSRALKDKFESEGFEVMVAENGAVGLEVALKELPDMILLDIAMPVMDGLEMLKLLKETEAGKKIKVIILTNYGDMDKFVLAKDLGADDYLVKADWGMADIVARVNKFIWY